MKSSGHKSFLSAVEQRVVKLRSQIQFENQSPSSPQLDRNSPGRKLTTEVPFFCSVVINCAKSVEQSIMRERKLRN